MKTILISKDVYDYLIERGMGPGTSASAVLRRELARTIEVDDEMYEYILSRASEIGESASSILRRELNLSAPMHDPDHPVPPISPSVVEFHIKPGTGSAPWNTQAEMVMGVVGQTLRVFNDDTVAHRLHTSGSPFSHWAADLGPGQSADFLLQSAFDSLTQPAIYDHNFGLSARFWITVGAPQ